ncbi:unnamed protein product [Echinostoma caproni]|uniref:Uncharacterized protein n=1 Tax=Echinostoma caproni TaxID=27848 RepID=A0A183BAK8_9TREM|nr:unnamed protein product [Echinostoma caproni]
MDQKLQTRATVNLTRPDIEKIPQISSPQKGKNLIFAPLVASTPDASFADITADEPTIVGILNRKVLSPMKPAHAPAKTRIVIKCRHVAPRAKAKTGPPLSPTKQSETPENWQTNPACTQHGRKTHDTTLKEASTGATTLSEQKGRNTTQNSSKSPPFY